MTLWGMTPDQVRRAHLYARLASLPDLSGLKTWEALKLLTEIADCGYPWLADHEATLAHLDTLRLEAGLGPLPPAEKTAEKVKAFQATLPYVVLHQLQQAARTLIGGLLAEGQVETRAPQALQGSTLMLHPDGTVEERPKTLDPHYALQFDLELCVRRSPFPFRCCPVCPTIFVPIKRQKYCSPACAARALAAARTPARRAYMRQYMAQRRGARKPPPARPDAVRG